MYRSIILTIQLDEKSDALLQDLRRRYFPPEINVVPAHLTLFHNLPGERENDVIREIARLAVTTSPFPVCIAGPMRLGRGVALRVESETLTELRRRLAERERFGDFLAGQDREKFRPHVTIQNKAAAHVASALFDHIEATLPAFEAIAEGIQLWRYDDGRWSPIAAIPFQAPCHD